MKTLLYIIILLGIFTGCEDVYNPELDNVDDVLVVDARIVLGSSRNFIEITHSKGFNDEGLTVPKTVNGAKVFLIDDSENEYLLNNTGGGRYHLTSPIDSIKEYKLHIEYGGNVFESTYEKVPPAPQLDTVYGISGPKTIEVDGSNDADDIKILKGVQLYANISKQNENTYYRFDASNVIEYVWSEPTLMFDIMHYYWRTYPARGAFNLAAPPEYSALKDIDKHPLYFYTKSVSLPPDHYVIGWIMILRQYALSESAYHFYKDLNAQLDADGQIFDPMYVQARNNMKCITDSKEVILGNFEISSLTEHRYFIQYLSEYEGFRIKEIHGRNTIPQKGETIDFPPDFWER